MLELDYRAKVILLALLDYGPRAFPRQSTLARKVGMGRTALQANIDRLRAAGLLATKGTGKALSYVVLPGMRAPRSPESEQEKPGIRASDARNPGRDPNYPIELNHLTKAAPKAPTGWEGIPDGVVEAIRERYPNADAMIRGQLDGVSLRLRQHKVTDPRDLETVWQKLVVEWASNDTRPFDGLERLLAACAGARDTRAVLMYRLRGAA